MPTVKKEPKLEKKTAVKKKTAAGMSIPVYGLDGKEMTSLTLPKELFSEEVNQRLLAQYVRVFLANQRQGTAFTKTRGEVVGTTKKIYKQKGTGNARHGSKKAPIFVGGGVVGGPRPRDYSLKMNRKLIKKALFSALTLKLKEQGVFGLSDEFLKVEPSTKKIIDFLKVHNLANVKILVVLPKIEKNNLILSMRNIANLTIVDATSMNPYEILNSKKIFMLKEGLQVFLKHYSKDVERSN